MSLVENDIERDAHLRMQRNPATDPVYDAPLHHAEATARIDRNSAYMEGKDVVAVAVAAFMTLAPLAVAAYGIGY